MARTRASVGKKLTSGKSTKARAVAQPSPTSRPKPGCSKWFSRSNSGGNPVCPQATPKWQKPITGFLKMESTKMAEWSSDEEEFQGPNTTSVKRRKINVIKSDEEDSEFEMPKNRVLDELTDLDPLTGENCHKIETYYPKKENKNTYKGKGVGKKSKKIT